MGVRIQLYEGLGFLWRWGGGLGYYRGASWRMRVLMRLAAWSRYGEIKVVVIWRVRTVCRGEWASSEIRCLLQK